MSKQVNFYWIRTGLCLLTLVVLSWVACRKNSFNLRDTAGTEKADPCANGNEVDRYICDSWVVPYNISVKYKFDDLDVGDDNIGVALVPPHDTIIRPILRAIKRAWIDVYADVAGKNFIRTLAPKQIMLVGSKRWQSDGTVTLGVAEGGKRILLFNVNEFNLKTNFNGFVQQIHTIHHEFAHILHQNILYSPEYRRISSPGDYTAQWFNVRQPDNLSKGFVTPYSMSSSDEDFVEVMSNGFVFRRDSLYQRAERIVNGFKDAVSKENGKKGTALLKQKQNFIEDYLRDNWKLSYKQIEDSVQNAMAELQRNNPSTTSGSGNATVKGLQYPY